MVIKHVCLSHLSKPQRDEAWIGIKADLRASQNAWSQAQRDYYKELKAARSVASWAKEMDTKEANALLDRMEGDDIGRALQTHPTLDWENLSLLCDQINEKWEPHRKELRQRQVHEEAAKQKWCIQRESLEASDTDTISMWASELLQFMPKDSTCGGGWGVAGGAAGVAGGA